MRDAWGYRGSKGCFLFLQFEVSFTHQNSKVQTLFYESEISEPLQVVSDQLVLHDGLQLDDCGFSYEENLLKNDAE